MDDVTVLIPCKGRPTKVAMTLLALAMQTTRNFAVVMRDEGDVSVMDSREVRQAWDMLSAKVSTIYLRSTESIGLVRAREYLLQYAFTHLLLWLDDDIVVPPEGIVKMVKVVERRKDFGFVIPIILDADNARHHDDYRQEPAKTLAEHAKLGATRHYVPCLEKGVVKVWRGNGGCMLCRTPIVRKVVKYDWSHVTTGEGEDMIASVLLADQYDCFLTTDVVVTHLVDPTHQWSWAKVAGSLVREYLSKRVQPHTLEASGLLSVGYKVVKD